MIKAELQALVENDDDEDWTHDAAAIVTRTLNSAQAGHWSDTILQRAADYMKVAQPGMGRRAIQKGCAEMAKKRMKEKKEAVNAEREQLERAGNTTTGSVAQLQGLVTGSRRQWLDASYSFVASEEDMLGNLVELQDNSMLCGQQISSW